MATCTTSTANVDRLAELLGDALPALVGLKAETPRPTGIVELLVFAELYARGRAEGCDRLDSFKIAAAELWTQLEVSEAA